MKDSLLLITLLVELGVAAAVSSSLARSSAFKRLLLTVRRSRRETLKLVAMICAPLMLGVWIRVRVPNFLAADISFEATILTGLLLGPAPAMLGGAALALPAMWHGEYWALPVNLLVAAISGTYGRFTDPEDVWSFSPLIDLSLYQWVTRNLRRPHLDRQILLLLLITAMQLGTSLLSRAYPHRFFSLYSPYWLVELAICAAAPVVVGIPLKIWNAVRIGAEAGGAVAAADGGAAGRAAAADQSAFSVQYAELDHVAGAIAAGAGAGDDREAREHSAGAAEGSRGVCAVLAKSWRLPMITWRSRWCALGRSCGW